MRINPVIAPTGITFYRGDSIPEWKDNLFFTDWNIGRLRRIVLREPSRDSIQSIDTVNLGGIVCNSDYFSLKPNQFYKGFQLEFNIHSLS